MILEAGDWVRYTVGGLDLIEYGEVSNPEPMPHSVQLTSGLYIRIDAITAVRKAPWGREELGRAFEEYRARGYADPITPTEVLTLCDFCEFLVDKLPSNRKEPPCDVSS